MVIRAFTLLQRESFRLVCHKPGNEPKRSRTGVRMDHLPYLADTRQVTDAAELIKKFGDEAGFEAAARADRSRELGNHIHFCRWRQIERLVLLMSIPRAVGTIH